MAAQDDTDQAIAELTCFGDLKVWSILVTVFGDLTLSERSSLSGRVLTRIGERIGIRPEAIRVALHRLRKDGWIESTRVGRSSLYALTEMGHSESLAARSRIYARRPPEADKLVLLAAPRGDIAPPEDFARIGPGLYLGAAGPADPGPFLVFEGGVGAIPDWAQSALGPPELAESYADLAACLGRVRSSVVAETGPLDTVVLRTLVIHHWRRAIRRHADLPERFFPTGWQGEVCREQVMELLDRLPPVRPELLEASLAG